MFKLSDNGFTDILIYVLIMVAGLIANAYKNYSKRKEKEKGIDSPRPQNPIFPEVVFEPVFEEYIEPEKEPEETYYVEKEDFLDSPVSEIDVPETENIPTPSLLEGAAVFENTENIIQSDSNMTNNNEDDLTKGNFFDKEEEIKKSTIEFDVAKAVIYSEILKPKYF